MDDASSDERELRGAVERFLDSVPNWRDVAADPLLAVQYFGFVLSDLGRNITPKALRSCYDAASMAAPANIPYLMQKSKAFVRTPQGTKLEREARSRIQASFEYKKQTAPATPALVPAPSPDKSKNVVVVHGRDNAIRHSMFQFLTALRLNPIEWSEAVRRTGRGSPYTGEVVEMLFQDAQATVVVLSPDEYAELRPDLDGHVPDKAGWQPRQNVLLEAGMAMSKDEQHTILVRIGDVRLPSDLAGRNLVDLDDSPQQRHVLAQRLVTAGCSVVTTGTDWLVAGKFTVPAKSLRRSRST